jgi:Ca-activated chloride channel family protein
MMRTVNVARSVEQGEAGGNASGGRMVTADGRALPLRGASLRADARGGVARVVLEQRFENVHDEPLHVTYLMPLPADGAVSGYAFTLGARRIVGEVDKKKLARERFEQALAEGRTAGLVEEERSSLFTQELGNVPPRSTIVAELTIDQPLVWLDEGAWEWRFPTVAGPRYVGVAGRVEDAARTEIAVADAELPVRLALDLAVRDALPSGARPESPAQALHAVPVGGRWQVGLAAEGGVRLDRDVVVRWRVAAPKVGLSVDVGRPAAAPAGSGRTVAAEAAYGVVSIVPPAAGSDAAKARRRDVILLLDTSGSMGGEPLAQARKVCLALLDTLGDEDRLEMIEFSNAARRWKKRAVAATAAAKREAREWLASLEAGGGTEMVHGVLEALAPIGEDAQRQVILVTDGYIGFETEVVKAIFDQLPTASRLHVVGVGSAVNRSLTGPSARAGRGVEIVVAPGEDPERPVRRLLARTSAPIVTDVSFEGDALVAAASTRLPDLYAGAPALTAVKLRPEGGTLVVRGRSASGAWEERVKVPAMGEGEGNVAAAALFARESVEALELRRAAGAEPREIDWAIERLGIEYQIATRLTTWLAVSTEVTVDPSAPTRREIVPQELPHGVSAEGLGLRREPQKGAFTGGIPMSGVPKARMMAMPAAMALPPAPASPARPSVAKTAPGAIGDDGGSAAASFGRLFRKDDSDEEVVGAPSQDELAELGEAIESVETLRGGRAEPAKEEAAKIAPAAPAPAPAATGAARRFSATLRLLRGHDLVLEILVAGAMLDWDAPAKARVTLADGRTVLATLDVVRSTRAGRHAAGQVIRVVLTLAEDPGDARPTQVSFDDALVLEVLPA